MEADLNDIVIPDPLFIEEISFIQQIFQDSNPPGIDYIQEMKVGYIRIRDGLIIIPNVYNLSIAEAESKLIGVDLQLGTVTTESNNKVQAGRIIHIEPESGTGVPIDTPVNIIVSSGNPIINQ